MESTYASSTPLYLLFYWLNSAQQHDNQICERNGSPNPVSSSSMKHSRENTLEPRNFLSFWFRIVIIFCATITHELHHRLRIVDTWYIPPRQNNLGDFEIVCNNLYFLRRVCKYNRLESDRFSSSWSVSLLKTLINKAHMCDYDGVGAQKKYSRTPACSPIDVFMTFERQFVTRS